MHVSRTDRRSLVLRRESVCVCVASPAGKRARAKVWTLRSGRRPLTCSLAGRTMILRNLVEITDSVYEVQDVPGRVKWECFTKVRRLAKVFEAYPLSPEAAAVLVEIQLHIGHC